MFCRTVTYRVTLPIPLSPFAQFSADFLMTDLTQPPSTSLGRRAGWTLGLLGILAIVCVASISVARDRRLTTLGPIEAETKSKFSHIRIRRNRSVRTMIFVRDSGEEALESQIDLTKPHELRFTYLNFMFADFLLRPDHQPDDHALIVGLGGGSMVHFLQRYVPKLRVDAVEIDPVVVDMAQRYFGVENNQQVKLITQDAFVFFDETPSTYSTIYMDAFLKPAADTDNTGVPLNLRTQRFYKSLQKKLKPDGVVVFNINPHPKVRDDLKTIRESFPQTYVFTLPQQHGLVVVGAMDPVRKEKPDMLRTSRDLDRRHRANFRFEDIVRAMD